MTSTTRRLGLPALLLLVAAGCGSSGPAASSQGTVSVHLMNAPFDSLQDLREVDLHILKLEAHSNTAGWQTLSEPDATFDLLQLTGGVVETLASGVALDPGKYTQFRLVLGPGQKDAGGEKISNLVVLEDGTAHDLTVPSGLQSGVKLVCQVDVQPGANTDVFISFEMPQSIHVHGTGASAKFILRPVIHCNQGPGTQPPPPPGETTGTITGELTALGQTETLIPLVGVTVTAQVLDAAGKASIVASTTTDGTGSYALANLPLGATYYVVSQPVMALGTPPAIFSWEAQASQGLVVDAAQPGRSFTAFFLSAAATGSVAGIIQTTAPNAADMVFVRQVLHTLTVIVRTAGVAVSGSTESFTVDHLPANSLIGTVYTLDAARPGGISSNSVDVTVTVGPATPATLVFP